MLSVTGFLGGITFAALVLILQTSSVFNYALPDNFPIWIKYTDILVTLTALVSLLFIVSSVGNIRVAAGEKLGKAFSDYTAKLADIGFVLTVVVLIPMLILPVFALGALGLLITGIFLLAGYRIALRKRTAKERV